MQHASLLQAVWEWLCKDMSFMGGPETPILSWLGAVGIVAFCAWHAVRLVSDVARARQAYARVWPALADLTAARRHLDRDWLTIRLFPDGSKGSRPATSRPARVDLDDVHALDRALRDEPIFERAWMQFRKTYVLEHTSWFIEPRVFSTRSSGEYFHPDDLLAHRLNWAFANQLPSLMTGIGLLFTFLAILIGLGKLHADAGHIVGIQGLINGLAGKFLTSIIGLVCANGFVMLEKSLHFRLAGDHQRLVSAVDGLFPRKTLEQMLENCTAVGLSGSGASRSNGLGASAQADASVTGLLAPSVNALTSAVESLTRQSLEAPSHDWHRAAAEVARGVREGLGAPMVDLQQAIQDLTRSVGDFKGAQERMQHQLEDLAGRLTIDLSHLADALDAEVPSNPGTGFRWLSGLRQRAVAR